MGLVTLTFDHLTLKLVCESHLRWGTFLPNLGTLGLWVLELFAMYATDGQTNGRTDKSNAYCPLPYGGGGIIIHKYLAMYGALIYLEALFYSPLSNQSIILYFLFSPLR